LFCQQGHFDRTKAESGETDLHALLPDSPRRAYDVHPLVDALLDAGTPFEEFQAKWAPSMVVGLGRLAGWDPLPLSVRDARRAAGRLRERLAGLAPTAPVRTVGEPVASTRGLVAFHGQVPALRGIDLTLRAGEVVALMGRNGAGKSTLLSCLVGLHRPRAGTVTVGGRAPHGRPARQLVREVGLVPQQPADLLYADTVAAECAQADRDTGMPAGTTRALFAELAPDVGEDTHPRDLSEGQRLALALAVVLSGGPPLILLDEPTRGLDYTAKARLGQMLSALAAAGHCILLATHDVELVAEVADRTVVLADGDLVADGPSRQVVTHSPAFAPQVSKVLSPLRWLTVSEVEEVLAG
jgi:energy-coupling factor transport system ATP-binding protein